MPSTRITKTNIDRDMLYVVQTHARASKLSDRQMLEQMIDYYIKNNKL